MHVGNQRAHHVAMDVLAVGACPLFESSWSNHAPSRLCMISFYEYSYLVLPVVTMKKKIFYRSQLKLAEKAQ